MKLQAYLNFDGNAEEAFDFYQSVFGGEITFKMTMGDAPGVEGLSEEDKKRLMHISLQINEDITLMASDIVPAMGQKLNIGNQMYISLHPDSRKDADRLFQGLSEGGNIEMPLEDQFWGDYFGSFVDKFGINWMINYSEQ